MKSFLDQLGKQLKNIKPFSWQTLILLSLFSWLMSLLTQTEFVQDILARLGWIFLTFGVGWATTDFKVDILGLKFYPGPWITGALACVFIFYGWTGDRSIAFISWPLISASIATVQLFFKHGTTLINPNAPDPQKMAGDRQQLVLLILTNVIISCWFQFHFLVQGWLQEYPSFLVDDLSKSAFVDKLRSGVTTTSRGVLILNLAEAELRKELEPLSWSEVERWLLNVQTEVANLKTQVMNTIQKSPEDSLWDLQAQVPPSKPEEYNLLLQAIWRGPSSTLKGYYAEKSCLITRNPDSPTTLGGDIPGADPTGAAPTQVICEPAADRLWIE